MWRGKPGRFPNPQDLERSLRLEGETPRVLEQMSLLCDSLGDPHAAAALYKKARRLSDSTKSSGMQLEEIDITPELGDKLELQGCWPGTGAQ